MKDQIILTGIHGFGFHGLFDQERKDGQDFFVDLLLDVDLSTASKSDDIEDTVNYAEVINLVVTEITTDPVNLIEKLGHRIADRILICHSKIESVTVTIHKPQAPVAAQISDIAVRITKTR